MKYKVTVTYAMQRKLDVEAEDEQDAKIKARMLFEGKVVDLPGGDLYDSIVHVDVDGTEHV